MYGVSLLLSILTGGTVPELIWLSNPLFLVVVFIYAFFLEGPVAEEFGWRGYALDRLQTHFNALVSSVILGFIWFAWHLPMFWVSGSIIYQKPMWGFILSEILFAILLTWLYNNTGGSILVALIFHNMFILSTVMFPALETELGSLYFLIVWVIVEITVLVVWGPKRLVREIKK